MAVPEGGESLATQRLNENADCLALVMRFLDGASLARAGAVCRGWADAALGGTADRFDLWRGACLRRWPSWPLGAPPRDGAGARRAFSRRATLRRLCDELAAAGAASRACGLLAQRLCTALGPEGVAATAEADEAAARAGDARVRAQTWALRRNVSHAARAAAIALLSSRARRRELSLPLSRAPGAPDLCGGLRLEEGFVLLSEWGSLLTLEAAAREPDFLSRRLDAVGIARRLDELADRVRALLRKQQQLQLFQQQLLQGQQRSGSGGSSGAGAARGASGGAGAIAGDPAAAAPQPSVRAHLLAVNTVLFVEERFEIAPSFADPRASMLADVLESRRGLPITLCAIYEAVCRRLGVPGIEPVSTPNVFVLKYSPPPFGADGALRHQNAPVDVSAGPRAPTVDPATALTFDDDEEVFIVVGFGGLLASRADMRGFIEHMGYPYDPRYLAFERSYARVWARALSNIYAGASPALLARTTGKDEIAALVAIVQDSTTPLPGQFFPEHAILASERGRVPPRVSNFLFEVNGRRRAETANVDRLDILDFHMTLAAPSTYAPFSLPRGESKAAWLRQLAELPSRLRCERALAALQLLGKPLADVAEGGAGSGAGGGGGGSGGGAPAGGGDFGVDPELHERQRHALFVRVLALLRGEADHAPLWREVEAAFTLD